MQLAGPPLRVVHFLTRPNPGNGQIRADSFLLSRQTDRWESLPDTASSHGPGKVMPCETRDFFSSNSQASL